MRTAIRKVYKSLYDQKTDFALDKVTNKYVDEHREMIRECYTTTEMAALKKMMNHYHKGDIDFEPKPYPESKY